MAAVSNPFLEGGYAPVLREETLTALPATGTLPPHLDGRYLRNGSNPIGAVDPAGYQWFMGDGMVHGVRLRDGRAEWYRNRWVRSTDASDALGEPRLTAAAFGIGANTNVIRHAGATLALVEAGGPCSALTNDLETVGTWDFRGTLKDGYTAHPKLDPATGELHAVSYRFDRPGRVAYSVVDARGALRRSIDVPVTGAPLVHDMGLSARHVVVLDLPLVFDFAKAMAVAGVPARARPAAARIASALNGRVPLPRPAGVSTAKKLRNADLPYSWDPAHPSRLGVLPRDGEARETRWFEVDRCFVFHVLGAVDETDADGRVTAVVVDAVAYDRVLADPAEGPGAVRQRLTRWRLDLRTGRVSETTVHDRPQEFPRIDERRLGGTYRYGYTIGVAPEPPGLVTGLVHRHDLAEGRIDTRDLGPAAEVGEFAFVPNGPDAAEDDGVLMGFVYDRERDASRLELLDAATLETVAQVHLPVRVPHGFHGSWVPAD